MSQEILDVDLLAFESGDAAARAAVVDGVMKSLETGFVYTRHDLSEDLLDETYETLASFFALDQETKGKYHAPESFGQAGYTGLLVETAATAEVADWKEMINFGRSVDPGHPLRRRFPHRYFDPILPDDDLPGASDLLLGFHDGVFDVQRRFMRIIATGLGCHASYFDEMLHEGPTLTRAIRYPAMSDAPGDAHVWAAEHGDINLITALPRATAKGLEVKTDAGWVAASPPEGHMIINTGMMLEHITNGAIPPGIHRVVADPDQQGERLSVVQFCHPRPWTILSPLATCTNDANPPRFSPLEAGDKLDQVIWDIRLIN